MSSMQVTEQRAKMSKQEFEKKYGDKLAQWHIDDASIKQLSDLRHDSVATKELLNKWYPKRDWEKEFAESRELASTSTQLVLNE